MLHPFVDRWKVEGVIRYCYRKRYRNIQMILHLNILVKGDFLKLPYSRGKYVTLKTAEKLAKQKASRGVALVWANLRKLALCLPIRLWLTGC
jgi:hypothetical protein